VALSLNSDTNSRLDEINRHQQQVSVGRSPQILERLGWLLVSQARVSGDSGYLKQAEQTAICLETHNPQDQGAMLLKGHVYHNLHRFKEAETIARSLVDSRGDSADFGLLGDLLYETGDYAGALKNYQQMVDLRPSLESYLRAGQLRQVLGDLQGAIEMFEMAVGAGNPADSDSLAWLHGKLAMLQLQAERPAAAWKMILRGREVSRRHAALSLAEARVLCAGKKFGEAAKVLMEIPSGRQNLEGEWLLADLLLELGQNDEARKVEERIIRSGMRTDPRTFSLYLATRGKNVALALRLARDELLVRPDIYTLDAVAWSERNSSNLSKAREAMEQAGRTGAVDARILLHRALIELDAGEIAAAEITRQKLAKVRALLFPSELHHYKLLEARLADASPTPRTEASLTKPSYETK